MKCLDRFLIYVSGLIGKFLSLKIYIPLSRITYSAYLINGFIELTSIGGQRNPFYMSISTLVSLWKH